MLEAVIRATSSTGSPPPSDARPIPSTSNLESSNPPAKKRKPNEKKATPSTIKNDQRQTASPPGSTLPELAAIAASQLLPSSNHQHHISSSASSTSTAPSPSAFVGTSSSTGHAALDPNTPLDRLTLRDLILFRDGLRSDLGEMKTQVGVMQKWVEKGDGMLNLVEAAMLATSNESVLEDEEDEEDEHSTRSPELASESTKEGQKPAVEGRRTEQDLEEYLSGLPTMEALPLRRRAPAAVPALVQATDEKSSEGGEKMVVDNGLFQ